jgi:hypothetical protein
MGSRAQVAWNTRAVHSLPWPLCVITPGKMPSFRLLTEAGIESLAGLSRRTAEAFAALRTASIQTVRVCDGSWTEWVADPATPKMPDGNA